MLAIRRRSGVIRPARYLIALVSIVLAGCSSNPTLRTDAAPGTDFTQFHTFAFVAPLSTDRAGYHSLVSQQLMFSTRRELEVRGLEFVADPAAADLLVDFYVDVTETLRVRSVPDRWAGPTYWNYRRGRHNPWRGHAHWPGPSRVEVSQSSEGRLSVDLINPAQNMLVWEGVASKRLTQRTMNDLGPAMDNAIHELFRELPLAPRL